MYRWEGCPHHYCTTSASFAPSFVRQPNGPECNQVGRNAPKRQFRVQWGGSGVFVAKHSDATSWRELLQKRFARFPQSFVRQPNGPECTQMVRNAPKHQFMVQWGGLGAFVAKNFDATSWHELCTCSARFPPSFIRQPNGPECTQIVRNAPKRQFMVQWGGSGAFIVKKFRRNFVARTFAIVRPVLHQVS